MTLILLVLILAGFAILSAKKPLWALGLILALLPTYQIRFQIFIPTTMLELLLVVFLITVFCSHLKTVFASWKKLGKINWAIALFLLAGIISVIVSPETIKALGQFKAFILEPVLMFYVIQFFVSNKEEFRTPLKFLFWSASAISLFGIIQFFTLLHLPLRFWGSGHEVRRIVSVFEYPNALALFLAPIFIFFAILLIKNYSLHSKKWMVSGLLIQALAILLTFSRGAWLGIAVVLAFAVISNFPLKKILPIIGLAVLLGLIITPIRQRLLLSLHDPSGIARVDLMSQAVAKLESNPLLGNGLYGFRTTLTEQHFPGEILNYPHNIVLNFWLELGLLGLISFGGIIWLAIKQYKTAPAILGLAAVCFLLVMVIHGILDVPYFKNDLAILFWFAVSVIYRPNT